MLKSEDIQKYHDDGFLVIRGLFSNDRVNQLKSGWLEIKQELVSGSTHLKRTGRFVFGAITPLLSTVYQSPQLISSIKTLLEEEDLALYMNRLLIKDSCWNGAVTLHQDLPYFHGGFKKVAVFVPVQSHNEATGGLKLVRGSHRFGNLGLQGTIQPDAFPEMEVITLDLEVGDVALMDFLTWHYSEAATIESDRPLLQIAYQSAADGSYYDLSEPTLVAGQWKTEYFTRYGDGIALDLNPSESQRIQNLLEQTKADLNQAIAERDQFAAQSHQFQTELNQALGSLEAMKTSKFWKARDIWMKVKKSMKIAR